MARGRRDEAGIVGRAIAREGAPACGGRHGTALSGWPRSGRSTTSQVTTWPSRSSSARWCQCRLKSWPPRPIARWRSRRCAPRAWESSNLMKAAADWGDTVAHGAPAEVRGDRESATSGRRADGGCPAPRPPQRGAANQRAASVPRAEPLTRSTGRNHAHRSIAPSRGPTTITGWRRSDSLVSFTSQVGSRRVWRAAGWVGCRATVGRRWRGSRGRGRIRTRRRRGWCQ